MGDHGCLDRSGVKVDGEDPVSPVSSTSNGAAWMDVRPEADPVRGYAVAASLRHGRARPPRRAWAPMAEGRRAP